MYKARANKHVSPTIFYLFILLNLAFLLHFKTSWAFSRGDEWSLRAFGSTEIFFANTSRNKKICFASLRATQKFWEHEQASTRLNFASKSSKGKILRAVKNFNGPFITPFSSPFFPFVTRKTILFVINKSF